MVDALTWVVLDEEHTLQCLDAAAVPYIRPVLESANRQLGGNLLQTEQRNECQVKVLLDLYAHLVVFAKSQHMTPHKVSTLVGIMCKVHEASMAKRMTRAESYGLLRDYVVRHSVHRPPYSTLIFTTEDVQAIDAYLISTYFRHYKMYVYCFVPREVATLHTVCGNDVTDMPPPALPPLVEALTEQEWKKRVEERVRGEEENYMEAEVGDSEAVTAEQERQLTLENPDLSRGIKEQLEAIKGAVVMQSTDRLEEIEEKLRNLETKVGEMTAGASSSAGGKGGNKRKK